MKKWTADNIPPQTGRTAIVTGANAGLGLETARVLAMKGARVIMACRSQARGEQALDRIKSENPNAAIELALLDLSRLTSIAEFVENFKSNRDSLDLLINNAGVMTPPASKTEDGFELQIGVNYLGHFALTAGLFELLKRGTEPRVVTLSSLAHRSGKIDIDSFRAIDNYQPWREYGQSKIACLMFALELHERLKSAGIGMKSLSAHPGGTKTDLQRHSLALRILDFLYMTVEQGTLPTLYCATKPTAKSGAYIGPDGWWELRGYPATAKIADRALDAKTRLELWKAAEEMTGVKFNVA